MRFSNIYGFFSITTMPNQPSVAWCSDFTVFKQYRGRGLSHQLKAFQNNTLKDQGYTLAMCSVKESNVAQIKVLIRSGWTYVISFTDVRTGEFVQIWNYRVNHEL